MSLSQRRFEFRMEAQSAERISLRATSIFLYRVVCLQRKEVMMKRIVLISALMLTSIATNAQDTLGICLITGLPSIDVKYEKIRRIKVGKNSYGGVADILPLLAERADALGANAVVNYMGSQRFGFWPWRVVRPVVRGVAVKLDVKSGQTCKSIGGASIRNVIKTNLPPHLVHA